MPKTLQIRDLDDDVYNALAVRAAEEGVSVPEYLRSAAHRLAARPSVREWLQRTRRRPGVSPRVDAVDALDEIRGSWPA